MAAQLAATLALLSQLPPAVLLVCIIVCVIFAACTLARFTSPKADDNGLNYEGRY